MAKAKADRKLVSAWIDSSDYAALEKMAQQGDEPLRLRVLVRVAVREFVARRGKKVKR